MTDRAAHDQDQDLGDTNTFVTAFGACIDPLTGRGQDVDAGHGLAVVVDADAARRLERAGVLATPWDPPRQGAATPRPGGLLPLP